MSATRLAQRFKMRFGRGPSHAARAPGRVNLLGEHVDYNRGLALPCGIQFEARVAVVEKGSGPIRLAALDLGEDHTLELTDLDSPLDNLRAATPDWARYPVGVCWAWVQAGHSLKTWDAAYTCDVPAGSGLSSSAAIEVAFAMALCGMAGDQLSALDLARLCQTAEHVMAGVRSGLMDPWTSVSAVKDHALLLDFDLLSSRAVRLPPGVSIVVADTGVRRSLATSAYNERVEGCRLAETELRGHLPELRSLRDLTPADFSAVAGHVSLPARQFAQHVVDEIDRVRQGVACLERGDSDGFGDLMRASHASLRDLYQVSGPELETMVEIANGLDGVFGSRLTGAGFGGATVSLVARERASDVCRQLAERYQAETGRKAAVCVCRAGAGAELLPA